MKDPVTDEDYQMLLLRASKGDLAALTAINQRCLKSMKDKREESERRTTLEEIKKADKELRK